MRLQVSFAERKQAIAYASEIALAEVCVDAASVAQGAAQQWICFGKKELP